MAQRLEASHLAALADRHGARWKRDRIWSSQSKLSFEIGLQFLCADVHCDVLANQIKTYYE
jgi:hypothetical protein